MDERVDLLAAKIMTVGERAEDVFYLASLAGAPLDEQAATACSRSCRARSIAAPPRESASRTTRRVPVRAARATEGRDHAARRTCRTSRCRSASRSTRRPRSSWMRCEVVWRSSTAIPPPPAFPRCAPPARPGSSGASACGGKRESGHDGAAGQRHARSAVLVRAGGGRMPTRCAAARRRDAQSVLSDLRRRGAARGRGTRTS